MAVDVFDARLNTKFRVGYEFNKALEVRLARRAGVVHSRPARSSR
jgi:hypothetical protein